MFLMCLLLLLSPSIQVTRKVKSIQMFRRPVSRAIQGDRVGVCVTQFDPKLLERGLVCSPGSLHTLHAAIVSVRKIGYFRGSLATRSKFHISVGHETVMARASFFGLPPSGEPSGPQSQETGSLPDPVETPFDFERDYLFQEEYALGKSGASTHPEQWTLLEFEKPVTCPALCLVIGSKLDTDIHANTCRLAFHGRLLEGFEDKGYAESALPRLRLYKLKRREGQVERVSIPPPSSGAGVCRYACQTCPARPPCCSSLSSFYPFVVVLLTSPPAGATFLCFVRVSE